VKNGLAVVLLSVSILVPTNLPAKQAALSDKTWVVIRPVQCLGNRWEKDWLAKHNNKGVAYPMKKEGDILREYFNKKGIPVLELRMLKYMQGEPLCQACDCPRGDTLYLLILASNAPKMVKLGYTERLPANTTPDKK
jgi:hypothetical protein